MENERKVLWIRLHDDLELAIFEDEGRIELRQQDTVIHADNDTAYKLYTSLHALFEEQQRGHNLVQAIAFDIPEVQPDDSNRLEHNGHWEERKAIERDLPEFEF